jgi:hypothetical protein
VTTTFSAANECNEVELTGAGECITEVTFYRDNKRYPSYLYSGYYYSAYSSPVDYGIIGMSFKTSSGQENVVGKYPNQAVP